MIAAPPALIRKVTISMATNNHSMTSHSAKAVSPRRRRNVCSCAKMDAPSWLNQSSNVEIAEIVISFAVKS